MSCYTLSRPTKPTWLSLPLLLLPLLDLLTKTHLSLSFSLTSGVTNIVLAIAAFRALEAAKKDRGGERPEKWTEDGGVDG